MEMWSGHPANYENLRIFGCVAYAHVKQGKLEPRAKKCIFLRYPEGVKGYKLWYVEEGNQKMIISRDVTFNENEMYHSLKRGLNASRENKQVRNQVELEVEQLEVES